MKEIHLTTSQVAFVDDVDFDRISQFPWFAAKRKHLIYARRNTPGFTNKKVLMHREILDLKDPKIQVDHIDGNPLNNQRFNLRVCTQAQNMGNRRKNLKGSSRFKGVSKKHLKWTVSVGIGGYVGTFDSEIEAAIAYNFAAVSRFGKFARLNEVHV